MNTGLPTDFELLNGSFLLTSDVSKARDSIWFFCNFNKIRIYLSDFGADFVSLSQKPIGVIIMNSTIILGIIKQGMAKYIPSVKVDSIDLGYVDNDRTQITGQINYTVVVKGSNQTKAVLFV